MMWDEDNNNNDDDDDHNSWYWSWLTYAPSNHQIRSTVFDTDKENYCTINKQALKIIWNKIVDDSDDKNDV
jgi:hypothetical protein